jgi:quercetin dioxygenase-like cupin family protein
MTTDAPAYLQTHVISNDRLAFSLEKEAAHLRAQLKPGGRHAITLAKQAGVSVVLIGMAAGNKLSDHSAPGLVTIQVVSGRATVSFQDEHINASPGDLVVVGPGVTHAVEAREDTAILVTISMHPEAVHPA